jgi:hypothetical protein
MRRRGSRVIETFGDVSVTGYVQSIRPFNPIATRWNITVGEPASSRAATNRTDEACTRRIITRAIGSIFRKENRDAAWNRNLYINPCRARDGQVH